MTCDSENISCAVCEEGFRLSEDKKSCLRCNLANCGNCQSDRDVCESCKQGFGFTPSKKLCLTCTDQRCQYCDANLNICTECRPRFYHLNGVCGSCLPGCAECYNRISCK